MSLEKFNKSIDSFLDGTFARLTKTHKICIAVAILLIPAALFYYLSFSPKTEEIGRLEKTKKDLEAQIADLQKKTANIEEFRKEKRFAEEKFAAVSVLLPQEKEIPSLLTNISGLGTSSGLDFLSFRPKPEIPIEFYAEIPVDIQVQGQYHSVGRFLDQISKLPRIVNVSNIKMGSPKREGDEMTLSTSFNLVTYRFIEQTAKNDKSKPKRRR